jgi:DNA-directed RNA polymerase subunit RPC12/RpoP
MGTGININCSECGYSKKVYLGVGIQYYPLTVELVQELIGDPIVKKEVIKRLKNDLETEEYYKALMKCNACNIAYEKFYVKFADGYETQYMCSDCQDPLELITIEQIEKTKCPRCHGKSIRIYDRFNWD